MLNKETKYLKSSLIECLDFYNSIISCNHSLYDIDNIGWPDKRMMHMVECAKKYSDLTNELILEFINIFTSKNFFTYGRNTSDPYFHETIQNYLIYITQNCNQEEWQNHLLQESHYLSTDMTEVCKRQINISYVFMALLHL